MKNVLLPSVFLLLLMSCHHEKHDAPVNQMVTIGRKESIESKILNEVRPYWVYVPPAASRPGIKLPVIYLLDGDAHFHSVSALVQILGTGVNWTYVIPEMIVVAIPNIDRVKDLTPSHSKKGDSGTSGGGNNFLKFIKDELIPQIDSRYPTNGYRTLIGHSFGGITTINALYTIPESFDSYIAIDPSLWWDDHLLLNKADSVFKSRDWSTKTLFISQANTLGPGESTNDHFGSIKEYVKVLENNKASGLVWSYKYYPDDSHGSVPFISEYDGLRFVFDDYTPSYEKVGHDPDLVKSIYDRYHTLPPEQVIEDFGYKAMREGNIDLAILYFQMNIDTYRHSSAAEASMANLWLSRGDSSKALQYYLNALQLEPQNKEIRNKVLELQGDK